MTFWNLLADLHRVLATSRPICDRLHGLCDRMSARCPDAAGVASLVVRLYDPSVDERWILELWPSTQLLLTTTATSLDAPAHLRRLLVKRLHQLRDEFRPPTTPDRRRPPFVRAPLAAFHWSLWRALTRRRAQVYVVLAALVHAHVRKLERGMAADASQIASRLESNLYRYVRPARVACMYAGPLSQLTAAFRHELIHAIADAV